MNEQLTSQVQELSSLGFESFHPEQLAVIGAVGLAHAETSHKFVYMYQLLREMGFLPQQIISGRLMMSEDEFKDLRRPSYIASGKSIQVYPDSMHGGSTIELSSANDVVVRRLDEECWAEEFKLSRELIRKGQEDLLFQAIQTSLNGGGVRRVISGDSAVGQLGSVGIGLHGYVEKYWTYRAPSNEEIAVYLWGNRAKEEISKNRVLRRKVDCEGTQRLYAEQRLHVRNYDMFVQGYRLQVPEVNGGIDWLSDVMRGLRTEIGGVHRGDEGFEAQEMALDRLMLGQSYLRIQLLVEAVEMLQSGKHVQGDKTLPSLLESKGIPAAWPVPISWLQIYSQSEYEL